MKRICSLPAVLLLAAAGCQTLVPPNWSNPGAADYQQSMAERFDPYPEVESGPAVVGARPLEYAKPPAEVLRARWSPWGLPQ